MQSTFAQFLLAQERWCYWCSEGVMLWCALFYSTPVLAASQAEHTNGVHIEYTCYIQPCHQTCNFLIILSLTNLCQKFYLGGVPKKHSSSSSPFQKGFVLLVHAVMPPPTPWEKDKLLVSDLQLLNRKEMPNLLEMAKVCSGSQFVKEASRFLTNFLLSFQLYFAKFEPAIPSFTHFSGSLSSVQLAKWVWVKTNSHQNLV